MADGEQKIDLDLKEDVEEEEMQEEDEKDKDLTEKKDQGILKTVLKKGTGWEKPQKDADVTVHYTGTLTDGTKFDSSLDRNSPFTFKLGVGQVIKGWDVGVASMKKGEKALFTIKSEYAYGKNGSPPKIPPDATLQFEVELISWIDEIDVTKDGGVMKKILHSVDGWETPKEDSTATINYTLKLPDGTLIEEESDFGFVLGADQVIEGLDKAVEGMKKGEKALIKIGPKYAYGANGDEKRGIPPNTTLHYEVELVDFTKVKASWEMSSEEKLEACKKAKDEGNDLYKAQQWKRAAKKYKKAAKIIENEYSMKDEEKDVAQPLKLACLLNSAACNLKLKEYKQVVENCKKALELDKANVKALFRRGQAHSELDDWEEAQADYDAALEHEPDNKEIQRAIALLKRKIAEQDRKDKERYRKMFSNAE